MKLVTTTGDLKPFYASRSVAAPLDGMRATGFTHIDLSFYTIVYKDSPWIAPGDAWKREIEDAKRIAEREGLDFCQAHSPEGVHFKEGEDRDALILATKRSIEACAMLGIPHTVIHAAGCGKDEKVFLEKNIAFYKLFEEEAERFGVDLLLENSAELWNPEYFIRTGAEARAFVEAAGIPRLHINWDTGHGNVQGCDQYSDILAMGDELRALHIQDNYGTSDAHVMPLAGTTNYDDVIRGLLAIGYKGDFTFEGSSTLRRSQNWPHPRRNIKAEDKLVGPTLAMQQKAISLMHDIGVWMLESYGIEAE